MNNFGKISLAAGIALASGELGCGVPVNVKASYLGASAEVNVGANGQPVALFPVTEGLTPSTIREQLILQVKQGIDPTQGVGGNNFKITCGINDGRDPGFQRVSADPFAYAREIALKNAEVEWRRTLCNDSTITAPDGSKRTLVDSKCAVGAIVPISEAGSKGYLDSYNYGASIMAQMCLATKAQRSEVPAEVVDALQREQTQPETSEGNFVNELRLAAAKKSAAVCREAIIGKISECASRNKDQSAESLSKCAATDPIADCEHIGFDRKMLVGTVIPEIVDQYTKGTLDQ